MGSSREDFSCPEQPQNTTSVQQTTKTARRQMLVSKDILLEVTRFSNGSENTFGNTMVLFNQGSTHIKLQSFLYKNSAILTDAQ